MKRPPQSWLDVLIERAEGDGRTEQAVRLKAQRDKLRAEKEPTATNQAPAAEAAAQEDK